MSPCESRLSAMEPEPHHFVDKHQQQMLRCKGAAEHLQRGG